MNRLEVELAVIETSLQATRAEMVSSREELHFYDTFEEVSVLSRIASLEGALVEGDQLCQQLCRQFERTHAEVASFSFFSLVKAPTAYLDHIAAKGRLVTLGGRIKMYGDKEKTLLDQLAAQKRSHALFKAIDPGELRAEIAERQHAEYKLLARKKSTSLRLEKIERKFRSTFEAIKQREANISRCEEDIRECRRLQELFEAANAYERRQLHAACAERFDGQASPGVVFSRLTGKLASERRQLEKAQRTVDEGIAAMETITERAFIDGNNLCFKHGKLIGLKPVQAVASALLAKGIKVTVVFDFHTGKGGKHIPFERIQQNFEDPIKIERAPQGMAADELLMALAIGEFDCVISNDQYSDYLDRTVVKERRVYKAVITDDRVRVGFLDIDESLPPGPTY